MQLLLTVPLAVETELHSAIELLPVQMDIKRPSNIPELWLRFLKTEGKRIPVSPKQADRIQRYMLEHRTEALSEDGLQAFTISGDALVECVPEVCIQSKDQGCDQRN